MSDGVIPTEPGRVNTLLAGHFAAAGSRPTCVRDTPMPQAALIPLLVGAAPAGGDAPPIKAATKRDDDRVTITVEKGVTVIDVRSPFGISEATVERTGERWPETVTLRLHLTGLESFTATCGRASLGGCVNGKPRPIRLTVSGREPPQGPGDPDRLDFRGVGTDGKPTEALPLRDGHFELRLPKAFFDGNPKVFRLAWIDWYRR